MTLLGWSTLGLPPLHDPSERARCLDTVFGSGFSLLEVHLEQRMEVGSRQLLPDAARASVAATVRDLRARGGRALLGLGGRFLLSDDKHRPTLFDADPAGRALRLRLVTEALELAGELELPQVIFLSGPAPVPAVEDKHDTDAWRRLEEALDRLALVASRHGVTLAPEAHSRHLFSSLSDLSRLRARIPALGFTADTVHQTIVEDGPLSDVYAAHAADFSHVQLDNLAVHPGATEPLMHRSLLEAGAVDVEGAVRALTRAGYQGALSVEFLRVDHPATDPLVYCQAVGERLNGWLRSSLATTSRPPHEVL